MVMLDTDIIRLALQAIGIVIIPIIAWIWRLIGMMQKRQEKNAAEISYLRKQIDQLPAAEIIKNLAELKAEMTALNKREERTAQAVSRIENYLLERKK